MAQPNYKPDIEPDIRPNLQLVDENYQPNQTAQQLSNAESRPNLRAIDGDGESTPGRANLRAVDGNNQTTSDINNAEKAGNITPTDGKWANKVMPKTITNKNQMAKLLLKRGGPAGGVLALVLLAGSLLGGIITPGSLFLNLKENLTLNWDQQAYTTEIRSRAILAKRFGSQSTSGACGKIEIVCRYTKPSNKLLTDLADAGVEAIDSSGNVIAKQRLLNGERPAFYKTADGVKVAPSEFKTALESDTKFRSAFRRAYNPRWVNWVDDAGLAFLSKMGLTKKVGSAIGDAADSTALRTALEDGADGRLGTAGKADDAAEKALSDVVENEITTAAETEAKNVKKAGKSDAMLLAAAGACAGARAPGIITSAIGKVKLAAMASVIFPIVLSLADKVKAGDGIAKEVENVGTMYTETTNTTDASGKVVRSKSAMDSGAMLYGLTGDKGSAASSTTLKKYLPGYTGNTNISAIAAFGQSEAVKKSCDAITSTGAQVAATAIKAAKATNPAGWIALGVDVLVWAADATGALDAAIDTLFVPMIKAGVATLSKVIDWNGILQSLTAGFIANARYEELGDMTGVTIATLFSDAAGSAGNVPLTPTQKVAFDQSIVQPTKLAWAQEDRLTHSPLDASNPNTFLGSITTQLIPYYSSLSSFTGIFTSALKLVGSAPGALLSPNTYATDTEADWNMCPEDGDLAVAMSGAAAGPLCDVQRAIPTEYINADPEEVAQFLYDNNQIDASGNVVARSDYENWLSLCTAGNSYSLSQCMIPDSSTAGTDANALKQIKLQAYMALYKVDNRTLNGMDNEPQAPGSTGTGDNGGSNDTCDSRTISMGTYDEAHDDGKKTTITLCAIPNLPAPAYKNSQYYSDIKAVDSSQQSEAEGKALVNARASGAIYEMIEAAKADGVNFTLGSYFAFRSYSHQKALRDQWCAAGDCSGAASPGYSNHEMGLAIDFDLPGTVHSDTLKNSKEYKWLVAHANEYGFDDTAMPKEDWHWAYTK